jgi:hypothetical protein
LDLAIHKACLVLEVVDKSDPMAVENPKCTIGTLLTLRELAAEPRTGLAAVKDENFELED